MEGRDLVLTGKPLTGHKYKEKNRPTINASWLPTRVAIPVSAHEQAQSSIASARRRSKDKSSIRSRTRPHSANVPGRKSFASTRPATGASAPVENTTLLSARDSKHSARIDLTTAQSVNENLTTNEPYCGKSMDEKVLNELEGHKSVSKVNCKNGSDDTVNKDDSYHGNDKQTLSAIRIQRWYRKMKANKLESSQKLVHELLQQKKDDLNKSRIAELEKVEARVCVKSFVG